MRRLVLTAAALVAACGAKTARSAAASDDGGVWVGQLAIGDGEWNDVEP